MLPMKVHKIFAPIRLNTKEWDVITFIPSLMYNYLFKIPFFFHNITVPLLVPNLQKHAVLTLFVDNILNSQG